MTHTGLLIVAGVDRPIIGEVEAHGGNYVLLFLGICFMFLPNIGCLKFHYRKCTRDISCECLMGCYSIVVIFLVNFTVYLCKFQVPISLTQ